MVNSKNGKRKYLRVGRKHGKILGIKISITQREELLKFINDKLESEFITQDVKATYCNMLEEILMATKNYRGFNYTKWARMGGYEKWVEDGKPADNTKYLGQEYDRFYY